MVNKNAAAAAAPCYVHVRYCAIWSVISHSSHGNSDQWLHTQSPIHHHMNDTITTNMIKDHWRITFMFLCAGPRLLKPVAHGEIQESPADAVKPARRKSMPKLLQFDVFRFISPNSISQNCQCIASRGRPIFSQALGLYNCTQFEIRCLPIIKFPVQIAST